MPSILQTRHDNIWTIHLLDDDNSIMLSRTVTEPISREVLELLDALMDAINKSIEDRVCALIDEFADRLMDMDDLNDEQENEKEHLQ